MRNFKEEGRSMNKTIFEVRCESNWVEVIGHFCTALYKALCKNLALCKIPAQGFFKIFCPLIVRCIS